ncbi:hypothetical protein [Sporomusa aerivorans]|uniref:hypothetical protein n=1 Tax=Sporomusa aerivorans TaxID=204936 RepID=UPI00352AA2E8
MKIDFSKPIVEEIPCGKNRKATVTITFKNEPSNEALDAYFKAFLDDALRSKAG